MNLDEQEGKGAQTWEELMGRSQGKYDHNRLNKILNEDKYFPKKITQIVNCTENQNDF